MLARALINDAVLQNYSPKLSDAKQQISFVNDFVSWESAKGFTGQFSSGTSFYTIVVRCQSCCGHLRAQLDSVSYMAHTVAAT